MHSSLGSLVTLEKNKTTRMCARLKRIKKFNNLEKKGDHMDVFT
jgi:hypothetical protein